MNFDKLFQPLSLLSLRTKILLYLLIFTIIPYGILVGYIYKNSVSKFRQEIISNVQVDLSNRTELINAKLRSIIQISNYTVNKLKRGNLLEELYRSKDHNIKQIQEFNYFVESEIFLFDSLVGGPYSYASSVTIFLGNYTGYNGKYIKNIEYVRNDERYREIINRNNFANIWVYSRQEDSLNEKSILLLRNINNITIFEKAVLELKLSYNSIKEIIDIPVSVTGGLIQHLDKNNEIIFRSNEVKEGNEYVQLENTNMIDGSTLVSIIPRAIFDNQKKLLLFRYVLIYLLIVILVIMVFSIVSSKITRGLHDFITLIKSDEKILLNQKELDIKANDDISILKKKFISTIKKMNDIYDEKSMLEFDLLQAKINPHLLYNSLSVIRWIAMDRGDMKTVDIINSMVKYYRMALNKGDPVIEVTRELEMLKEYMVIINNTYSEQTDYKLEIEVEEAMKKQSLLKHILQPIVENSIMHGLNGLDSGTVTVKGSMESKFLVFKISDDGHGIDEGTVESILNLSYVSVYGGYGIKNSIKRIKLYYGNDCGISIKSVPGCGTEVTVRIKQI